VDLSSISVGIDGYNLAMPQGTGVATYARTLADAVKRMGCKVDLIYGIPVAANAPPELRETLFYGRLSEEGSHGGLPQTLQAKIKRLLLTPEARDLIEIPTSGAVITTGLEDRVPAFDRLLTRGNLFSICARYFRRFKRFMPLRMERPPAIMHWTYPLPLRLEGSRNIYTIHDLVPLRLPHTSLEDKRYYHNLIKACIDTAAHIVTVSDASKRDIIDLFNPDPARLTNSYQTFETPPDRPSATELARRLDRLFDLKADHYLLFFGAIEPKKNIGRLIEAYLRSEITTPLVIVGGGGWKADQELRLLRGGSGTALRGAGQIRQIDYLPRRMLFDLIQGSRAVLFPSLYEGFGLPALEAIALGAPLLTSNTSSLPEVAGEAALYVDPYDVGAITAALRQLDSDDSLRARLRAAGERQANKFAAETYSKRVEQIYSSIL
jgi:glycosyltransferase involved in cell wall biosynthesis